MRQESQESLTERIHQGTSKSELLTPTNEDGNTSVATPENNPDAKELTAEQISEVNRKLEPLLSINEDDTQSVTASEGDLTVNPICYFFTSYYENVTDLDLGEFVYYIPRETYLTEKDKTEIEALKQSGFDLPFDEIEKSPVPFGRIPYAAVDETLKTYANISLKDMTNTGNAIYADTYESFYSYASDFGVGTFYCTNGTISGDTITLHSKFATLVLKREGDNYYIVSHIENKQ
ncbi:MAG: hypothetical protein VB100_09245 [Angelakisella sp.]|nr:hypothetical protein [Angelakisella sp.]